MECGSMGRTVQKRTERLDSAFNADIGTAKRSCARLKQVDGWMDGVDD